MVCMILRHFQGYTIRTIKDVTVRQLKSLYREACTQHVRETREFANIIRASVNADKKGFEGMMRKLRLPSTKQARRDKVVDADSVKSLGLSYEKRGE